MSASLPSANMLLIYAVSGCLFCCSCCIRSCLLVVIGYRFINSASMMSRQVISSSIWSPVQRFPSDGELRKLQDHDPLLGPAIGVHLQKFPSPVPSAVANIVANTVMLHNVLCHETPHGPTAVVPQAIRQLLLYYTHDLAGHFSHPYVMDKLRGWYWPCLLYTSPSPRDS